MAVAVRYNEGRLVSAMTRGDGVVGEAINPAILERVRGMPSQIDHKGVLEVRGELVLSSTEFARLDSPAANQRNAVVGMVRSGDLRGVELDFIGFAATPLSRRRTLQSMRSKLKSLGFQTCCK